MTTVSRLITTARNSEVNSLAQGILNDCMLFQLETDTHLIQLFGYLQERQEALNSAIKACRTKSNLATLSDEIKRIYRAFYQLVMAYCEMPDFSHKLNAEFIAEVLNRYNKSIIQAKAQFDVNSDISSLIADLELEVASDIEDVMYLSGLFSKLKLAQENYINSYTIFKNQRRMEIDKGSATVIKTELIKFINDNLVLHLNAMLKVAETDYVDFCFSVDTLINDVNNKIRTRLGRTSNTTNEMESETEETFDLMDEEPELEEEMLAELPEAV
ncbi:MAG: DUF6261 family protein [Mangrovibacterium sp.]